MGRYRFTVYVETDIDIPADDEYGRTEDQFAEAPLVRSGTVDASRCDGWADLSGTAYIAGFEYEGED